MLLALLLSSYGCTWKVWRAVKKLELLSANRLEQLLRFSRALHTSRVHPYLDRHTLIVQMTRYRGQGQQLRALFKRVW